MMSRLDLALAELWPQCHLMLNSDAGPATLPHPDGQNVAICQELESLLTGLQTSWHALHHHSQACSVMGGTPGIPPCSSDSPQSMLTSSQPLDSNLPSIPESPQQQQQPGAQHQCLQLGVVTAGGISTSNESPSAEGQHGPMAARAVTHSAGESQHPDHSLFPGPILSPSVGHQQQQQQQQTGHGWSAHQQKLTLAEQQAAQSTERLVLSQEATQGAAHSRWLWGGVLLSAQQLWESLIYDTQVVDLSCLYLHSVTVLQSSCHVHLLDLDGHTSAYICALNIQRLD